MMDANLIYCGDCAKMMNGFIQDDSIDLIYLDPPFFSQKNYEVIWGDGYEVRAFEDRWKGGIENYISWMEPKLRECHRVLKQTGSMYLHCDPHANAHLRILMDKVFGVNHFQNELIWHYSTGGASKKIWASKHDNIYLYSKGNQWTFNYDKVKVPYADSTIQRLKYKGARPKDARLLLKGIENGSIGKIPDDVWSINSVQGNAKESFGYPTQKPEALLERIIKASSNPNDIVLDPFCGCGTAIAVAHKLKRRWIGIDVSPTACKLMRTRMTKLGITPKIIGLPKTLDQIKDMQPFEFQNWVLQQLVGRSNPKRSNDLGIDGHLFDGTPVQVKQSEGVGRNVIDNFHAALLRAKKTKGIIVAFSFGKGSYEEVARLHNEEGIMIELKTVEDITGDA